jgi:hypothetical protein
VPVSRLMCGSIGRRDRSKHSGSGSEVGHLVIASLFKKCSTKAMVLMDGCMTCLNCGESKCG